MSKGPGRIERAILHALAWPGLRKRGRRGHWSLGTDTKTLARYVAAGVADGGLAWISQTRVGWGGEPVRHEAKQWRLEACWLAT